MGWFEKTYNRIKQGKKKIDVPDGLWTKCSNCDEMVYNKTLNDNLRVCPKCNYHFYIDAWRRIDITLNKSTFLQYDSSSDFNNPLDFPHYEEKLKKSIETTDLDEAVLIGEGKIAGKEVVIAVTDFKFMGGSMGLVVGNRIAMASAQALEKGIPLIIVSGSGGGARMQEGVFSLMQMAKVSGALAEFKSKGGLYISILTHPTMGGAMASFASRGDIILAEPGALLGFAGPRVIRQTIKQQMPRGFQYSESLLKHGMVDLVVHRNSMRSVLIRILNFLSP